MGFEPTTPTLARLTSIDPFRALDRCNSHERPICTLEHPIALRLSDVSSISPPVYVSCSKADQVGGYRTSADMRATRLEQRGEFPRRFYLTSRCVVWDLSEVEAWIEERRRASDASLIKRAPSPDVRLRKTRAVRQ